jgi:hypothetical protein
MTCATRGMAGSGRGRDGDRWPRVRFRCIALAALLSLACVADPARSQPQFTLSGYGTLGYAIADQDVGYLRYIDKDGTIKADSLFGLQLDARLDSQWSVTVQGVASAPRTRDSGYEAAIRWAFVGFRPRNDWLLRAGRLRPPVLIATQNAEVGVTYDVARLPAEVYTLSPVYDVDGAAVTKTWLGEDTEVDLDAYFGSTRINYRLPFQRFGQQPDYFPERITLGGLVVSYINGPLLLRGGVHRATLHAAGDLPFRRGFTTVTVPGLPPVGGTLYLPSQDIVDTIGITVLTLGADWHHDDWRVIGEYGQRIVRDIDYGADSKGAYVTVSRSIGQWTPYATYARLLSGSQPRNLYRTIDATPVPLAVLGPPFLLPPTFHQALADSVIAYDQYSTMLGTSYSFSATSKLKLEWMHTHIGLVSALVDANFHHRSFNVYSISYSFAF